MDLFLDRAPRAINKGPMQQNVIEADFASQVIHAVRPEDEEHRPLCGDTSEASFVADVGRTLKPGWRWCGACQRIVERT